MSNLTSEQLLELAKKFRKMANETSNLLVDNWLTLSAQEREHLQNNENALRVKANEFLGQSVPIHFDNLEKSLEDINNATNKLNNAMEQIDNVQEIIKYTTLAVKLGAAISTGNFGAISAISGEIYGQFSD
jgi:hypothetical protein